MSSFLDRQLLTMKDTAHSNEKLSQQFLQLTKKYDELSEQHSVLKSANTRMEKELKGHLEKQDLENQLKSKNSELLSEITLLKHRSDQMVAEFNNRLQSVSKVSSENFQLGSQVEKYVQELNSALYQNQRLLHELEELRTQNEQIVEELKQLNSQKNDLREELEEQSLIAKEEIAKAEDLGTKLKKALAEKQQLAQSVEKQQYQLKDNTQTITSLELTNRELHTKITNTEGRVTELEELLQAYEKELSDLKDERAQLLDKVNEIETQLENSNNSASVQVLVRERDGLMTQLKEEMKRNDLLEQVKMELLRQIDEERRKKVNELLSSNQPVSQNMRGDDDDTAPETGGAVSSMSTSVLQQLRRMNLCVPAVIQSRFQQDKARQSKSEN